MSRFKIPEPDLQVTFFHRLREIRETYLIEGITEEGTNESEDFRENILSRIGIRA